MKRLICFVLVFCMAAVLFCGCSNNNTENTTASAPSESTSDTESESTSSSESSSSSETEESSVTEEPMQQPESIPQSIKILAIGNSFSTDATEYLWNILHDAGIQEVIVGNLYISGCSVDTHWENMSKNKTGYTFYYNNSGKWEKHTGHTALQAIQKEDWDYITVQQASPDSGKPQTLGNLQNVLDYVNTNKTNDNAKIYWHMTWAYQFSSSHTGFPYYGQSQMTMYDAIVSTYTETVSKYNLINGAIPAGTAIQNLRTSYLDDALNLDGYHMSYDTGRYTVALTWFSFFTGIDPRYINWVPEEYPRIAEDKAAICHAINQALKTPFAVTPSIYTKKPIVTEEMTDADKAIISSLGYNPDDYRVLDLAMELRSLYACANHSKKLNVTLAPTNKQLPYTASSTIFTRDQIPAGSIISVAPGYEYSPEAWINLGQRTPKNLVPGKINQATTIVDDAWWGVFQYRAFNLTSATANMELKESDLDKLRVYVPKKTPKFEKYSELTQDDISVLSSANLDPSKYQVLNLDLTLAAFYKSTNASALYYGKTYASESLLKYIATQIFDKTDLPNGTVISLKNGYEYRPEGWTDLNTSNAERPAVVDKSVVIVDDAWWGSYNYRAFNIAARGEASTLSYADINALRIYVPKN